MSGGVRESVERVLLQHQRIPLYDGTNGQRCVGCDNLRGETDGPNSPRHVEHLAEHLLPVVERVVAEARAEAFGDGKERGYRKGRERGRAAVVAKVEAVLAETDEWTPYDSRDTGETFLAESVRDLVADLRAALGAGGEGR